MSGSEIGCDASRSIRPGAVDRDGSPMRWAGAARGRGGKEKGPLRLCGMVDRKRLVLGWAIGALCLSSVAGFAGASIATDRGKEFLRTGQYEKAKAHYEEWIAKDAESVDAIAGMGSVLIAYADFDGAMDILEGGLKLDPNDFDLRHTLGLAYYYKAKDLADRGRSSVAVGSLLRDSARTLEAAIQSEPERFEGYQALGLVQQFQSEFGASVESFKKATILKGDDAYTWYQLGESLRFDSSYEEAVDAYGRAAELFDDGYYEAYRMQGFCYQFLEEPDKASEAYLKAIDVSPETLSAWDDLWNLFAAQKEFKAAAAAYRQILKKHPKNAYCHLVLGSVYAYDNDNKRALSSFKKALDHAKTADLKSAAFYQMGITYNELDNKKKSIDALQRALKVSPEFEDPITVLSGIARENSEAGTFRTAAEILDFLANFKKTDGFIWSDLGLVYRDWGKYPDSLAAYEKAYKFEPNDAQIINDYAVVLDYHFDRVEEALPLYVDALELENNIDAMQNLTRLYLSMGKFDEAIEMAQQALEFDSSRGVIRQMLDDAKRRRAQKGS